MQIGDLDVRQDERQLCGPSGVATIEPLAMRLFLLLASRADMLVTRRSLFDALWGSLTVGEDSLNRAVAILRRTLERIGVTSVAVETVPAAGYVLRLAAPRDTEIERYVQQVLTEARASWRLALPEPDYLRLALLESAVRSAPGDPALLGWLALLRRQAAEYAVPEEAAAHVLRCDSAAQRALELEPGQVEAATALVGVAPLYGRWSVARHRLEELCTRAPDHHVPANDLAIVEMATGQVRAAKSRRDRLMADDPLAAQYCYKSVYQHWSVGDLVGMDHVANRAMQLWPLHPAVWAVRMWTLAYTGRCKAALGMLDGSVPQGIPNAMQAFFRQVFSAADAPGSALADEAADSARRLASQGPALAVAALFAFGLLERTDDAFAIAARYYHQDGDAPVPLHPGAGHPRLNEQHRRLTQILFTPVCEAMRDDPRFTKLCDSIGLTAYWDENGISPDYRAGAELE